MLCEWMKTNYLKRYYGQILEVNEDMADRNQEGMLGQRKTQGNWVVEIDCQLSGIEVVGDIGLRGPRPTQGCKVDDDDDDDDDGKRYASVTPKTDRVTETKLL